MTKINMFLIQLCQIVQSLKNQMKVNFCKNQTRKREKKSELYEACLVVVKSVGNAENRTDNGIKNKLFVIYWIWRGLTRASSFLHASLLLGAIGARGAALPCLEHAPNI